VSLLCRYERVRVTMDRVAMGQLLDWVGAHASALSAGVNVPVLGDIVLAGG
jgi:hypothetical protein